MRFDHVLLIVLLGFTQQPCQGATRPGMVTFIKAGQVYIAREDGSSASRISPGDSVKAMPKWSPDGRRVVYLDSRPGPHSLGLLVVADTRGTVLSTYSVSTMAADGTEIAGMRFIENIGWMDNAHLFAEGSVNPHVTEYRTIDVASGRIGGFGGSGFATCVKTGRVAFWLPVFPPNTAMTLKLSTSEAPVFTFPDWNALPTIFVELAWNRGCEALGFVDQRAPAHFVLVVAGGVQKAVLLPGKGVAPVVKSAANGFLIGSDGELYYRLGTSRVVPTPPGILAETRARNALRKRVETELGATDADYQNAE